MNTILTDFNFFIEHDSNPFILFSGLGKILYLNQSAELLLLEPYREKKLFNLTLSHAPKSFGCKKTLMELSFGSFEFYAINVLYNNEDEIALHLYNKPTIKIEHDLSLEGYTQTDLNLLLEANIELFKMKYQGEISIFTDYDLPLLQIHQNNFSFILRKIFEQFQEAHSVNITLKIKIGEMIVVNHKRYPIILFKVESTQRKHENDIHIKETASSNYINVVLEEHSITLEIPAIN
jgi:hypothetical protein